MPLPKPKPREKEDDFVSRCMADSTMNDEYPDEEQRAAVCYSQFRGKAMNDMLLQAIRNRGRKKSEFSYGIMTADRYVQTIQDLAGLEPCYKLMSKGGTSYDDLVRKAAKTLVYGNPEMVIEEKALKPIGLGVDLPKNCLMAFRHVLTTSTKDRDGDVLHSEGATADPKMLLLWQHVHTMPIGKMLKVYDQDKKKLSVISCIVDMNELSHDAAVMVDNDMGRFSHGFRAIEFTETKAGREGNNDEGSGFDVTKFEIMEESLVSVPANVDAQCEEVLLSLVEGGKLTSPIMKHIGRGIREHRSVQVPGVEFRYRERDGDKRRELVCRSLDQLKAAADAGLIGVKTDEDEPGDREQAGEGNRPADAPKEADVLDEKQGEAEGADAEKMTCPKCEEEVTPGPDGKCPKCGAVVEEVAEEKGDSPGHEFHGNQWGEGSGRSSELVSRASSASDKAQEVSYKADNSKDPKKNEMAARAHEHASNVNRQAASSLRKEGETSKADKYEGIADEHSDLAAEYWSRARQVGGRGETSVNGSLESKAEPKPESAKPEDKDAAECPKCGSANVKDGVCQDCGYEFPEGEIATAEEEKSVKQGRSLSKTNEQKIKDAVDDINEAVTVVAASGAPRSAVALLRNAARSLADVLSSIKVEKPAEEEVKTVGVREATAIVLTDSTVAQRKHLADLLRAIEQTEQRNKRIEMYRALTAR